MFGIGMVVFGVLALSFGIRLASESSAKKKWPVVTGRLVERDIQRNERAVGRAGAYYEPKIKYTYAVDGREYVGGQMYSRAGQSYGHDTIKKAVDELPGEVPVHYDPRDPASAFLLLTSTGYAVLAIVLGAVCALLGVGALLASAQKD